MRNLLFIILIFSFSCNATSKHNLGLNLETGKVYFQNYSMETNINQEIQGQNIDMKMTAKSKVRYTVLQELDEYYEMEVKYDNLIMEMQTPYGPMEFNSEKNDPNDIFSRILSSMIKHSFMIKMNFNGTIREVKNIDKLFESVFEEFPNLPEMQKAQVEAQLQNAYGEKAFKGNFEMVTAIFPDKEVAVNESWENQIQLESGMSAKMNNKYTLLEYTKDYAVISGNSVTETEDKDAYVPVNGMPTRYDLSGTMISTIKIDSNTGWTIEANINQELGGNVEIKDNPNLPGGMTIPMKMKNKMVILDK